ncbi:MAG: carboxypeptidase-like regulatory domain-containing protein [Bacteroidia bacterium]
MKAKKIISMGSMVAISIGLMFSSCSKDGSAGPTGSQGPSGPNLQGSIYGYISFYNQYGTKLFSNLKNAKVSLVGTTTVSTTTDSLGHYSFANVSTGTYSITVSDSSYGSNEVQQLGFVGGGGVERDIKISQIPNFSPLTVTTVDTMIIIGGDTTKYVKVRGTVGSDNQAREMSVFVGATSSASAVPANYLLTYGTNVRAKAVSFTLEVPATDLYGAGFTTGSMAYIAVYGAAVNYASSSSYEDYNTGRTIYNAISVNAINSNVIVP